MSTTPPTTSPVRLMKAFLDSKQRFLSAIRDYGGLFEVKFLRNLVQREQDQVTLASCEADTIRDRLATVQQHVLRDTAATDDTPGVIDAKEARELLNELCPLSRMAARHSEKLQRLI